MRTQKPPIGTPMWHVLEHLYYEKNRAGPLMEYVVREARVTGYFQGGYTEIRLTGKNAGGFMTPYSYPLKDIGEKLFYTPEEAARLDRIGDIVPLLRQIADIAGFEIIGRIPLRDKATGKEYR